MVKIKICGITNIEDAQFCADIGVDAIGFIFYNKSKRYIEPKEAKKIVSSLPPFIIKVGVFVNEKKDKIISITEEVGLNVIQLHGNETPQFCTEISKNFPVIKSFPISEPDDINRITEYTNVTPLFDTKSKDYGGTGNTFDWNLLFPIKDKIKYFILAGGLTASNVKDAIKLFNPYAVDISSSVEKEAGKKDYKKIEEFVRNARGVLE